MLDLKLNELRLRGCGFTLFPAAEANGVDSELMHCILFALHTKLGLCSGDFENDVNIEKQNPNFPDRFSVKDIDKFFLDKGIQCLIDNGLVKIDGNDLVLTQKSIKVLKDAAAIQKDLDCQGFHFCPCHF